MEISYDLARGFHIIAVIAWMAGLLMLPRFFAYQTGAEPGGELERKMIVASASLLRIILNPAMIVAWVFGLYLAFVYDLELLSQFWLVAKLTLVIAMTGFHMFLLIEGRKLAKGERPRSEKFWRMLNEVPFVMAIAIVLFATAQPTFG